MSIAQGAKQSLAVAEVELKRRGVALTGGNPDLAQGHAIESPSAQQLLSNIE
jgi:hypothetical protein